MSQGMELMTMNSKSNASYLCIDGLRVCLAAFVIVTSMIVVKAIAQGGFRIVEKIGKSLAVSGSSLALSRTNISAAWLSTVFADHVPHGMVTTSRTSIAVPSKSIEDAAATAIAYASFDCEQQSSLSELFYW